MKSFGTLRVVPAVLAGVCVVLTITADPAAAQPVEKPRIALVMKSLANEFFQTMEKGAREHQKAHEGEYELLANGIKNELDVSRQVQLVEQMIAQKVNAIVIAPADSKALVTVCKKAMDAGLVVVNIDNKFDEGVLKDKGVTIPFVGPDNRKGACKVGAFLASKLEAGAAVAIVEGVPTAFNAAQRKLGFEDAVNAAGLKIAASQSASWEMAKANQVVAAMVTEHPEIKGLLCANDSMALGAVAALKAADKTGAIKIAGFDNISAVQDLIREGKMMATADQHGDQLAVFGIEYALDMLAKSAAGRQEAASVKGAPGDRETPVDLITAETLKP